MFAKLQCVDEENASLAPEFPNARFRLLVFGESTHPSEQTDFNFHRPLTCFQTDSAWATYLFYCSAGNQLTVTVNGAES